MARHDGGDPFREVDLGVGSTGTAATIIAEVSGVGKGERYFPVAGRSTDSPRDILRTPADNSAAFRCVLTRPVVDCHHSQKRMKSKGLQS